MVLAKHLKNFHKTNVQNSKHKICKICPVVAAIWLSLTAGIIIEFNRFFPDLLFHPMS